jgi:hypothetical protein
LETKRTKLEADEPGREPRLVNLKQFPWRQ